MALQTLDEYFKENRKDGEAFFGFANRVLVEKFGGAARAFYDKKNKFIHIDGNDEKLLTEIQRKEKVKK